MNIFKLICNRETLAPLAALGFASATSVVLIVARLTPEGFKEEKRYELGTSATWSMPVLLPDGLLVREATGIVRLHWS